VRFPLRQPQGLSSEYIFSLAFQMQNAPSYQAATTVLDIEAQTLLMEVMRIAEQDSTQVA
jgi:hypothetical protein